MSRVFMLVLPDEAGYVMPGPLATGFAMGWSWSSPTTEHTVAWVSFAQRTSWCIRWSFLDTDLGHIQGLLVFPDLGTEELFSQYGHH